MDNLVFEESISAEVEQSEFISKKWVYVNDMNNTNYTTQVVIDTTPLANSGGYVDWQEGYIVMPLVLEYTLSAGDGGGANKIVSTDATLKSGFWHMINSMQVEYNNQTAVQQTPFINVHRGFKAITSFSQDDLKTHGPTTGFYPDSASTWAYGDVAGVGVNNGSASNGGLVERASWPYSAPATQSGLMSLVNSESVLRSTFTRVSATTGYWKIYARLRLKDLSDFFCKTPLLKGSTIRLLINTNQMISTTVDSTGVVSAITGQGYTNPIQTTDSLLTKLTAIAPGTTATFSLSIFKNPAGDVRCGLQSCRLYAPVYKMNPVAEQRYLSLAPTKKVSYRDVFQYQFNAVDGVFNILVSNGIPNIKSVLVVPLLSSSNTPGISSPLSPLTSAPASPDPIMITNFNIMVSGVNLFLQNQLYDYEQFIHELGCSNQLNGALTTGLTSGLVSLQDFEALYRYYYGNCSRILPSEEGVSRSVQLIGEVKASGKKVDLMVFVEFEKHMTIDIATGARID